MDENLKKQINMGKIKGGSRKGDGPNYGCKITLT
jgi:hypothetical protein